MESKIEEMKCPYCGNEKDLEYGDLVDSGYNDTLHWADWEITCPVCNAYFTYKETYRLENAYNDE